MTAPHGTRTTASPLAAGTHECHLPDVVNQLAAVTRATQEVAAGLLDDHVRHCVLEAARDSGDAGQVRMDEVAAAIRQVIRL